MYDSIAQYQTVVIRQISRNRAEQVAYYRYLENEQVTLSELVRSLSDHCQKQVSGRHILSLSPNGLGVVGNNHDVGFFIRPSLAVNAENGFPLGLSHLQLWSRAPERPDKHQRDYAKLPYTFGGALPYEQKESYKWLASAEQSQRCLAIGEAKLITHIGDREADLYEAWTTVPNRCNYLLVRVHQDHRLFGKSQSLYRYLSTQPCEGTYSLKLVAEPRTGRTEREALLAVRCATLDVQRPAKLKAAQYPASLRLYAVEAKEVNPPLTEEPVHWRLLTSHPVVAIEQALQVLQWYCWRWRIEQLFATLKLAGLDIEASQLESVEAIQRLTVLALSVAVRTLQMVEGRDNPDIPASVAFCESQQQCLTQLAPSLQGQRQKQQNPYPLASLPWATWLIARLGGWSGYRSQRPPEMPTVVHGLRRFEAIFIGWKTDLAGLVCTP